MLPRMPAHNSKARQHAILPHATLQCVSLHAPSHLLFCAGAPATSAALLPPLSMLGSRLYRTLGALTATWLSRLMLAQMPGLSGRSSSSSSTSGGAGVGGQSGAAAADGEMLALAGRLVQGALTAPAQLLVALGEGGAQLEAAEGVLQGPAVAGELRG